MIRLDSRIKDWLAEYVDLPYARDDKGVSKLERRLRKIISNGPDGRPQGPVWILESGYKTLVERSAEIHDDAAGVLSQISNRIEVLRDVD
jgi:hypothetical protein